MHKIYSRPRIRLPKLIIKPNKKFNNEKSKKHAKLILIVIIAICTAKLILDAIYPIFNTLCEKEAKAIATLVSNEQATAVMKEHTYDELFTVEKDNNGNITMIKSNVIPINEIISDVANKIQIEIDKKGRENVEIPVRKFYRL